VGALKSGTWCDTWGRLVGASPCGLGRFNPRQPHFNCCVFNVLADRGVGRVHRRWPAHPNSSWFLMRTLVDGWLGSDGVMAAGPYIYIMFVLLVGGSVGVMAH